jgi:RNA polymerase sigma-70 factor (ECF subfamily)
VAEARSSPEALRVLLERYWRPVYAYFRRLGESPHAAADLTQGFLARVVADRRLLASTTPERGRFRTYLKAALRHHRVDEIRREIGRDGTRPLLFAPEAAQLDAAEPGDADDPAAAFDRAWAATTLSVAVSRLERDCRADGLDRHWEVFRERVLGPSLTGGEPAGIETLVRRLDLRDADECSKMLFTVKRKARSVLRDVVAETVAAPSELEDELHVVRTALG